MSKAKYIVIEGPEGVGKTTQIHLLGERLRAAGLPVRVLREPDSQSDLTARTIRLLTQDPRYPMNTRTEVLLYNAARSQSLEVIRRSVEQGIYCLVDRNYLTTLAVQYYGRGDVPDYETINNIISFAVAGNEPDLTIILDAPVSTLRDRLKERKGGDRFDNLDEAFLERVRAGYLWEAQSRKFPVIYSTDSVENVSNQIWQHVTPVLSSRDNANVVNAEPISIQQIISKKDFTVEKGDTKDLLEKIDGRLAITKKGEAYLKEVVTSATENVYAFKEKMNPVTVAAAMARLSRRGDDMRITLLDEFSENAGKDEKLLQRVITAYGDDSVQQLAGLQFVIEGASNILTKKLEWGRLAAYLEQSTRYIYFDHKNAEGKYKYYVPTTLGKKTTIRYVEKMDKIFDIYSDLVHKLCDYLTQSSTVPKREQDAAWRSAIKAQACDAIRPVLPVSTKSTVGIYASAQAAESLIMHLMSDEFEESRSTGEKILKSLREVAPVFFERADLPDRGGASIAYKANTFQNMKKLSKQYLGEQYDTNHNPVKLVGYWPKNEMELLPDMLFEHSNLSLSELNKIINGWSLKRKTKVFQGYIGERLNRRHKPGRALEKAHYTWELVCDYGIFRDLQRHRMVDNLQWQALTPRYGYDIPLLVEEAGLSEKFQECFDISLELYSLLQAEGYDTESQYATLLGHKMRWQVTVNARESFHLHELRTSPQGHPGYRKLVQQMHEKLLEVHPLIGDAMIFVNKGEDPELTRLAAERYTQFKLSKLA